MANATFTWQIPSAATPATGTTRSASVLALTDYWWLYVGPVRQSRAEVVLAPPSLDPQAVWDDPDTYPHVTLWINARLDLSTTGNQPSDGSIQLDSIT